MICTQDKRHIVTPSIRVTFPPFCELLDAFVSLRLPFIGTFALLSEKFRYIVVDIFDARAIEPFCCVDESS